MKVLDWDWSLLPEYKIIKELINLRLRDAWVAGMQFENKSHWFLREFWDNLLNLAYDLLLPLPFHIKISLQSSQVCAGLPKFELEIIAIRF